MSSFLIGATIHDQATVEQLPTGAVVIDSAGDAWQRTNNDRWDGTRGRISATRRIVNAHGPLLLIWLPPENGAAR